LKLVTAAFHQQVATANADAIDIEIDDALPYMSARWRAEGGTRPIVAFSTRLAFSGRQDFGAERFARVLPILIEAVSRGARGSIVVNLDDVGWLPGLAFCDNQPDRVLIPDAHFLATKGYAESRARFASVFVPWEERKRLAFWRGRVMGAHRPVLIRRVCLCKLAAAEPDLFDVGLSGTFWISDAEVAEMRNLGLLRDETPEEAALGYRYQIAIEGVVSAWSGLYHRLLTGSPVLKVASADGYRQWYYDRLQPWVNFVPVASDLSDLVTNLRWLQEHDDEAHAIGRAGRELALSLTYEEEFARAVATVTAAMQVEHR
jgi:hypothetical protein